MPDTIAPADTPFTQAEGRQVLIVNPADFPVQLSALPAGTESIGNVGLNAGTNLIGQVEIAPSATAGLAYQFSIAAAATSGSVTPAANSALESLMIGITGDAAQTTAGEVSVTVALNGATLMVKRVYVPAVAIGTGELVDWNMDFSKANFSTGASGALTVTLSNALTAGTVYVNALFAA